MNDYPHPDTQGQGAFSGGDRDQLQPEDTLLETGVEDVLDEGYAPPERPRSGGAWDPEAGTDVEDESLEERLAEEVPDTWQVEDPAEQVARDLGLTGTGADGEPGEVDPAEDHLGDAEVGDARSGRLVAPDAGQVLGRPAGIGRLG